MATKVVLKLEGMDALKRAVTETPKRLRELSSGAVRETVHRISDRMRRTAPHQSGTLLTSIESDVAARTGVTGKVIIKSDAFYWRFLEYGTIHMAARPFVRPAAESESAPFINRFREVARILDREWGR